MDQMTLQARVYHHSLKSDGPKNIDGGSCCVIRSMGHATSLCCKPSYFQSSDAIKTQRGGFGFDKIKRHAILLMAQCTSSVNIFGAI